MERAVVAWLSSHHGVVSRRQATELGLSETQVSNLVRRGAWRRRHPGVYQLAGTPWDAMARLEAAMAAAGPGAVVSHDSAAWLFGLLAAAPAQPCVTIPASRRVEGPAGVRLIRTRQPTRRPVTVQGLPCTDAIRTLVDCAAQLKAIQVDAMVDAALAKRLISVNQLIEAVEAGGYHFTPGRKHLGERMAARGVTGSPHPSVLESHMSRLIQGFGLPFPRAEVHWGPDRRYRLDFAYPELKLAIEVDGLIAHFSPEQQRYDLRRRNALVRQGWTVLYYTWRDVLEEPDRVAAEIAGEYRRLHAA